MRIEAPEVEPELQRFVIVHDGGRSAPELRFFLEPADLDFDEDEDEEEADDRWDREAWTVELLKPGKAPQEDGDLWEAQGLPWAGNGFIPVAGRWQGEDFRRPDHRQLALFEGLLRALAATAEADLDSGRWEMRVATAAGPLRFVLSLPELLEPPAEDPLVSPGLIWRVLERSMRDLGSMVGRAEDPFLDVEIDELLGRREEGAPVETAAGAETPEGRAEDLLDRAYRARGRRAVLLARQALEAWPDCADAYSLLARRAPDPESGTRLFELGVAAGERALGPAAFAEAAGHFWGVLETRPYMRARQGLAESLVEMDRPAEAVEHFQEMLRLNPGDNQGIRHSLVNVLITLDRDAEAWELLDRFPEDGLALLEYPRALLRFRREGDSPGARKALQRAVRVQPLRPGAVAPALAPYSRPAAADRLLLSRAGGRSRSVPRPLLGRLVRHRGRSRLVAAAHRAPPEAGGEGQGEEAEEEAALRVGAIPSGLPPPVLDRQSGDPPVRPAAARPDRGSPVQTPRARGTPGSTFASRAPE